MFQKTLRVTNMCSKVFPDDGHIQNAGQLEITLIMYGKHFRADCCKKKYSI